MGFILHPPPALRQIRQCADKCESHRQRLDPAILAVDAPDLRRHPAIRQGAAVVDAHEDPLEQRAVLAAPGLAEVGNPADVPQQPHRRLAGGAPGDLLGSGEIHQGLEIVARPRPDQARILRMALERRQQRARPRIVQIGIAPLQRRDRRVSVLRDRPRQLRVQIRRRAGDAEGPVALAAPRPPGDLPDLVGFERPHPPPVELLKRREGDVPDVEVEAHADRVGGDEIVHLAILVELDLGVARARAQRPHHHGRAALAAAQQLGDLVDALHRESDDRAARRHARHPPAPGMAEPRHPLAAPELGLRDELADHPAHRRGSEELGLLGAAHAQQPVGEHMAAVRIGAELDLVHGDEIRPAALGHRLHRADPVARPIGHDPLLAGHQRDCGGSPQRHDPVVDLPRQQPQRQADHAGLMREHPLDRVAGLARVGGTQNGKCP